MSTQRLEPLLSHKVFRWASGISAAVALLLGVLGSLLGDQPQLRTVHAVLAMVFLLTSLTAGLSGMRYGKESRTPWLGTHGLGVFVLALAQYALGEMGQVTAHWVVGLLIVLAAGFLFVRSRQQPAILTSDRSR